MQEFLAIYIGGASTAKGKAWDALPEDVRNARMQEGMAAWHGWMETHKDAVAATGGPLGKTKAVSDDGVADIKNAVSGFVIVRAESHAAAAAMFENHPHFAVFPGDRVEVMPVLPMPGQG